MFHAIGVISLDISVTSDAVILGCELNYNFICDRIAYCANSQSPEYVYVTPTKPL